MVALECRKPVTGHCYRVRARIFLISRLVSEKDIDPQAVCTGSYWCWSFHNWGYFICLVPSAISAATRLGAVAVGANNDSRRSDFSRHRVSHRSTQAGLFTSAIKASKRWGRRLAMHQANRPPTSVSASGIVLDSAISKGAMGFAKYSGMENTKAKIGTAAKILIMVAQTLLSRMNPAKVPFIFSMSSCG